MFMDDAIFALQLWGHRRREPSVYSKLVTRGQHRGESGIYDYVGRPIWLFCSYLSCFMFFSCFFMFYRLFVWLCSIQLHFIDLFSCIAASLFNKLT